MRYAVYLLLLANLALFAWLYRTYERYAPPEGPAIRTLPATVESLRLLSERGANSGPVRLEERSPPGPTAPAPPPAPADKVAVVDGQRAGPLPVPVEPPDTVPLDAERDGADVGIPPEVSEPAPVPPARICQTIGPFLAREDAQRLVDELAAAGPRAVIRVSQMQQPNGYWVYLPEMERSAARRTVRELQAKGVEDYYLGRQNVISLGLFSDRRTAEARMREITAMGYEPSVEERFKSRDMYWLDLEEWESDRVSDERWQMLLGPLADIRRQPVSCE